jgi:hypothetical protein
MQLTYTTTNLDLPDDLFWSDENQWYPVEQSVQRTLTGAQIVQSSARVGGRPITLQPVDDRSAWITRATLDTLREWAAVPGRQMTLTLRGVPRAVLFRHQDGAAVEASPIVHYADVVSGDLYTVTLRFMEV